MWSVVDCLNRFHKGITFVLEQFILTCRCICCNGSVVVGVRKACALDEIQPSIYSVGAVDLWLVLTGPVFCDLIECPRS